MYSRVRLVQHLITLAFLAKGIILLTFPTVWYFQDEFIRDLVMSRHLELVGMIAGGMSLFVGVLSLVGGLPMVRQKNYLIIANWILLVIFMIELVIASIPWFDSLQLFESLPNSWAKLSTATRANFQNRNRCCGFMNPRDNAVPSDICTPLSVFPGCGKMIIDRGTNFLTVVYTTLFGFDTLDVIAFLANVILLKEMDEEERNRRVMEKLRRSGVDYALKLQYV
ncbi:uncharacterized protein VTP21DRAFT_3829 [Calcarisporiella thermophila]|uniref:uncharacterized protein n=1 Tax=Calcarisporiella thermophila TaxID=911321 RepID=UPI0037429482